MPGIDPECSALIFTHALSEFGPAAKALIVMHGRQVVAGENGGGMVLAEYPFLRRQRTLKKLLGILVPAKRAVEHGEIVEVPERIGMIRPLYALPGRQCAP